MAVSAWYATREMIKSATDGLSSPGLHARIDRAIEAESRGIDLLCLRPPETFVPVTATRTFDWPDGAQPFVDRIYLDPYALASVTSVTSGGVVIPAADYFLRPQEGPPYRWLEIDAASDSALGVGETAQASMSIAGVWVLGGTDVSAGTLTAAITTVDATTLSISAAGAASVGVGSVLLVGAERMLVTGRSLVDSTKDTTAALTDSLADTSVPVTSGTSFAVGETIVIDSERMTIDDTAGNNLIVSRGADRTAVAAHVTSSYVYVYRTLTVTRGALGSTAATHLNAAAVSLRQVAGPVQQLCVARVLVSLAGEASAYASLSGGTAPGASSDGGRRPTSGVGLDVLTELVRLAYGRKMRHRAV